jgi:hypothetical protein
MTPGRLARFPAMFYGAAQCIRYHALGSAYAITSWILTESEYDQISKELRLGVAPLLQAPQSKSAP